MATSNTDLANRALRLLKGGRITSLTEGSNNANTVQDVYDSELETLLRGHTWNFAKKFVTLARLSTAPAFKYDFAYALPDDWLRTIAVHDNDAGTGNVNFEEAEIEDVGALFCSIETVFLSYVYRVTDPNRMPPDAQTAFVYALAVAMPGISNISAVAWEALEIRAVRRLIRAKSADALGQPPGKRPAGSWATSRQSWPSSRWPR